MLQAAEFQIPFEGTPVVDDLERHGLCNFWTLCQGRENVVRDDKSALGPTIWETC